MLHPPPPLGWLAAVWLAAAAGILLLLGWSPCSVLPPAPPLPAHWSAVVVAPVAVGNFYL